MGATNPEWPSRWLRMPPGQELTVDIALIGTRGIPANYGGFETCAEEIAIGLVRRGHNVTVYCRPGNAPGNPEEHEGVRLVHCGYIESKFLGTLSHTFRCMRHARRQGYDVLMVFNVANAILTVIPRLAGSQIAINVDGLEWKRAKWGPIARLYGLFSEWLSTKTAHRVVTDNGAIQDYYEQRYKTPSTFIAYGAHIESSNSAEVIEQYGLSSGDYFFVASRLEPENNADLTIDAFRKVETDKKLVIAGSANWKSPYIERIQKTADERVIFLGGVYEPGHIKELHAHCFAYVHGNEVGGTNPALLKALGYGNCVLALDNPFNAEVVADAGVMYSKDPSDLTRKMQALVDHPEKAEEYRRKGVERIRTAYRWDTITEGYEKLFQNLVDGYYKEHPESE